MTDTTVAARQALAGRRRGLRAVAPFLGPAFIASVAYIDPGNFATNMAGGTDLAEFTGAALGLHLVFGLAMWASALLAGLATFAVLGMEVRGFRRLEAVITSLVVVVILAFGLEMLQTAPAAGAVAGGVLEPRLPAGSALLAVSITGATVMPHVIYLHSSLTKHRVPGTGDGDRRRIFRFEVVDVLIAMGLAGIINLAMLATAAAVFGTRDLTAAGGDLGTVYSGLNSFVGAHAATVFGVALLVSGIASSCVGTMSGQVVMQGFLHRSVPVFARRAVTMLPALVLIASGFSATRALVLSQALLSFGIPFALIPLVFFTADRKLMGSLANKRVTTLSACAVTAIIMTLNIYLLATS